LYDDVFANNNIVKVMY